MADALDDPHAIRFCSDCSRTHPSLFPCAEAKALQYYQWAALAKLRETRRSSATPGSAREFGKWLVEQGKVNEGDLSASEKFDLAKYDEVYRAE